MKKQKKVDEQAPEKFEDTEHHQGRTEKENSRNAWATANKQSSEAENAVKIKHKSQHSSAHRHS
ncbi:hypothetical protein CIK05_04400 [Bdellovibrio sp. qaytius]|nr:hypothetical protein CIK05_04400 [Bdellovibrio sp. qaytius]